MKNTYNWSEIINKGNESLILNEILCGGLTFTYRCKERVSPSLMHCYYVCKFNNKQTFKFIIDLYECEKAETFSKLSIYPVIRCGNNDTLTALANTEYSCRLYNLEQEKFNVVSFMEGMSMVLTSLDYEDGGNVVDNCKEEIEREDKIASEFCSLVDKWIEKQPDDYFADFLIVREEGKVSKKASYYAKLSFRNVNGILDKDFEFHTDISDMKGLVEKFKSEIDNYTTKAYDKDCAVYISEQLKQGMFDAYGLRMPDVIAAFDILIECLRDLYSYVDKNWNKD